MEAASGLQSLLSNAMQPAAAGTVGPGGWVTAIEAPASNALSVLQGRMTAASMAGNYAAGIAGLTQGILGWQQSQLAGSQERMSSEARGLAVRDDLLRRIGNTRVAYAASGLDLSSDAAAESGLQRQAGYQLDLERNNAVIRALSAEGRGMGLLAKGSLDLAAGIGRAANDDMRFKIDLAKRG